jgi:hypothetical protein
VQFAAVPRAGSLPRVLTESGLAGVADALSDGATDAAGVAALCDALRANASLTMLDLRGNGLERAGDAPRDPLLLATVAISRCLEENTGLRALRV